MTAIFTKETDGTTVQVAFNKEFIIELEENPTTGYNWNLTPNPGVIVLSTSFENSNTQAVGRSGTRRFTLAAIEKGISHLDFLLKRPWDEEDVFIARFSLVINAG